MSSTCGDDRISNVCSFFFSLTTAWDVKGYEFSYLLENIQCSHQELCTALADMRAICVNGLFCIDFPLGFSLLSMDRWMRSINHRAFPDSPSIV
jgi:hypothetical protein